MYIYIFFFYTQMVVAWFTNFGHMKLTTSPPGHCTGKRWKHPSWREVSLAFPRHGFCPKNKGDSTEKNWEKLGNHEYE